MPTPQQQLEAQFAASVERVYPAIAAGLQPLTPFLDAEPRGMDAVVTAAILRALADIVEVPFGEGNDIGPLKQLVDEFRMRFFVQLQKSAAGK